MKKTILVSAISLMLLSVLATACHSGGETVSASEECDFPAIEVGFYPSTTDSIINPNNSREGIDTSTVCFAGVDSMGNAIDSSGILELSVGSQLYSIHIESASSECIQEVDSIWLVWSVSGSNHSLNVLSTFPITTGYAATMTGISNLPGGNKVFDPDTTIGMKFALEHEDGQSELEINGGLAVVVITIDPADLPVFQPVAVSYHLEGNSNWIQIPFRLNNSNASDKP